MKIFKTKKALQAEIEQLKDSNVAIRAERDSFGERLRELIPEKTQLHVRVITQDKILADLKERVGQLQAEYHLVQVERDTMLASCARLEGENIGLQEQIKVLRAKYQEENYKRLTIQSQLELLLQNKEESE